MTTLAQRSFAGGEIAPALYARVDQVKYASGLRVCRNFLVARHGGVYNRPGTSFVAEVKDSTKSVRLIKFVFNSDQTYVLEFGNTYIRFYRNEAQIQVSAVTAWSGATNYVVGDLASSGGVNYYCIAAHINHAPPNALYWYALTTTIYEIPSPYLESELPTIQLVQSADVITLVHPNHAPMELRRSGHTSWVLASITFAPGISAPTNLTNSGAAGAVTDWIVTAVAQDSLEESLQSSSTTSSATPSSGSPITLSWTAVSGAQEYNVYKKKNGIYGFIGVAGSNSFIDNGITADTSDAPPIARNPFNATGDYPSCVTYFQQRRFFANTDNDIETAWGSRSGNPTNFTISSPLQDDDAVTFSLIGRQVNEINHLVDLGKLLAMTSGGEWAINGDSNGVVRPAAVNASQQSYNGSSTLPPIIISGSAIYVQGRGSIVRDLGFDFNIDGYRGSDLTVFAAHLFDGYTLADWDYQQIPHSIVWAARTDGALIGMTYVREQQILAWHRHDFDGFVENVVSVPEGDEDALYLVVNRTINSVEKRYIERMRNRRVDDIVDAVFMDCALTLDGRNTGSRTMTLSGSGWTHDNTLTLTASSAFFSAGDVGNSIFMYGNDSDGDRIVIRCEITAYTSTTVVSVRPHKDVPTSLRAAATTDWSRAVDQISGLGHLEGKAVSVFADGFVVGSPNNSAVTQITVTSGAITLERPYAVIHVGLPITADIETLDPDTAQGESIADKKKIISRVTIFAEETRGLFVGGAAPTDDDEDPLENLTEMKLRDAETYDDPVALLTGTADVNIMPEWNNNGRIFIRQVDPIPAAILAVYPSGKIPLGNGG